MRIGWPDARRNSDQLGPIVVLFSVLLCWVWFLALCVACGPGMGVGVYVVWLMDDDDGAYVSTYRIDRIEALG